MYPTAGDLVDGPDGHDTSGGGGDHTAAAAAAAHGVPGFHLAAREDWHSTAARLRQARQMPPHPGRMGEMVDGRSGTNVVALPGEKGSPPRHDSSSSSSGETRGHALLTPLQRAKDFLGEEWHSLQQEDRAAAVAKMSEIFTKPMAQ